MDSFTLRPGGLLVAGIGAGLQGGLQSVAVLAGACQPPVELAGSKYTFRVMEQIFQKYDKG
jgi:hypothetical protein